MGANHNGKINEALELLNDAAQHKKDEILKLVTNKYADFREAVESTKETAGEVIREGQVRVRKAAKEVDKNAHKNPWAFIGAAAGTALLLGFILGKVSNNSKE